MAKKTKGLILSRRKKSNKVNERREGAKRARNQLKKSTKTVKQAIAPIKKANQGNVSTGSKNERQQGAQRASATLSNTTNNVKKTITKSSSQESWYEKQQNKLANSNNTVRNNAKTAFDDAKKAKNKFYSGTDKTKYTGNKKEKKGLLSEYDKYTQKQRAKDKSKLEQEIGRQLTADEELQVFKKYDKAIADGRKKTIKDYKNANTVNYKSGVKLTDAELSQMQANPNQMNQKGKDGKANNLTKKLAKQNLGNLLDGGMKAGSTAALDRLAMSSDATTQMARKGLYSDKEKKAILQARDTRAYKVGSFIGEGLNFLPAGGAGASLAKNVGKAVVKGAGKDALKVSGKNALKAVGKEIKYDSLASLPLNVQSAVKDSTDIYGNFNKKAFVGSLAMNVAGDVVLGGVAGGVGKAVNIKSASNYANLVEKINKSGVDSLTTEELKRFEKLNTKFARKEVDNMTIDKGAIDKAKELNYDGTVDDAVGLKDFRENIDAIKNGKLTNTEKTQIKSALPKEDARDLVKLLGKEKAGTLTVAEKQKIDRLKAVALKSKIQIAAEEDVNFSNQVDSLIKDNDNSGGVLTIGSTPEQLQRHGIRPATMKIKPKNVIESAYPEGYLDALKGLSKRTSTGHNLGVDAVKSVRKDLENPTVILKGSQQNSFVVFTRKNDYKGNPVMVAVHLDKHGNLSIDNEVTSIYGKGGIEKYLKEQKKLGNVIFESKKRGLDTLPAYRLQLPVPADLSDPMVTLSRSKAKSNTKNSTDAKVKNKFSDEDVNVAKHSLSVDNRHLKEIQTKIKKQQIGLKKTHDPVFLHRLEESKAKEAELLAKIEKNTDIIRADELANATDEQKILLQEKYALEDGKHALDNKIKGEEIHKKNSFKAHADDTKVQKQRQSEIGADIESLKIQKQNRLQEIEGELNPKTKPAPKEVKDSKDYIGAETKKEKAGVLDTINKTVTAIRRETVDDLVGLEQLAKQTVKKADKSGNDELKKLGNDLMHQTNAMRNASNEAKYVLHKDLSEAIGKYLPKNNKELYNDFQDYLFSRHNIDRYEVGKGVFGDVSSAESIQRVAELEKAHPEFKEDAEKIYKYLSALRKEEVDAGLVSKDMADMWEDIYPDYVPTYRQQKKGYFKNYKDTKDVFSHGAREATGGDTTIVPLHEQLIRLTEQTFKDVELNRTLKIVSDIAGVDAKELSARAAKEGVSITPDDVLRSRISISNGKATYWAGDDLVTVAIGDEIAKGIKNWSRADIETNIILRGSAHGTSAFKKLIIDYNPFFTVKNGIRDAGEGLFMYSKNPLKFAKNYPLAYASFVKGTDDAGLKAIRTLYEKSGGKFANLVDLSDDLKNGGLHPLQRLEKINNGVESAPRLAEFISCLEEHGIKLKDFNINDPRLTKDIINEAMYRANDITINFGRSGRLTRKLNHTLVPFLNPSVQGFSKLIRSFQGENMVRTIIGTTLRFGALGVGTAVANEVLLGNNKAYQSLNDRDKDANFYIALPDGKFLQIPKSRAQVSVSAPFTEFFRHVKYGDVYDMQYVLKEAWQQSGVVNPLDNSLPYPLFRALGLKKTWYGSDLETYEDEQIREKAGIKGVKGYSTAQIKDENTSWFAKKLGNTFIMKNRKVSPKQIDNVLDSYTGILGDVLLPATALKGKSSDSNVAKRLATQLIMQPTTRAFVKDSAYSNKYADVFFKKLNEAKTRNYALSDKPDSVENPKKVSREYELMSKAASKVTTYSTAINDIEMNTKLSSKQKNEQIRLLKQRIADVQGNAIDGKRIKDCPAKYIGYVTGNYNKAIKDYADDSTQSAFKVFKKSIGANGKKWKNMSKAEREQIKDFSTTYNDIYKLTADSGSHFDTDYMAVALVASEAKNSKKIISAYRRGLELNGTERWMIDSDVDIANKWHEMGFKNSDYAEYMKPVNTARNELKLYEDKYKLSGTKQLNSLILANKKQIDAAFYGSCYGNTDNMNPSRGLATFKNWQGDKGIKKYANVARVTPHKGYNSAITAEDAKKACNKYASDKVEKACLFAMLTSGKESNPFGEIPDFSLKGDTGLKGADDSKGGRRDRGRRRGGRGGGGSGSSYGKLWDSYYDELVKVSKSKAQIKAKNNTSKSALTEAYRKREQKQLEKLRKS